MKCQKFVFSCMLLFLVTAVSVWGAGQTESSDTTAAKSYEFKWATQAAADQPATIVTQKICDEIAELSKGRIKITLYSGGSLGSESDNLDMLRVGTIHFMTTGPSIFNSFYDPVQALTLPYLFRDPAHAYKFYYSPMGEKIFNDILLQKTGIRTLTWRNYGFRVLTTKGINANKPEDLRGSKIRSMGAPVAQFMVKTLGATPVPVAFNELYVAMQTGVVQGQENPIANIVAGKFFEVQDYVILTNHQLLSVQDCVHEATWQGLDAADRELILGVMKKYMPLSDERISEYEKEGLKLMESRGVKIITPDQAAFRKNALEMIKKEYSDKTEWMEIVNYIDSL